MFRNIDLAEYTDGKKYNANDMVRIACNDCQGCSKCCHGMGNSIVLDPWDVKKLCQGLNTDFESLLKTTLELNLIDDLILPNIKMQENTDGCIFLNDEGRCSIHDIRPGFCRMFPLGRLYENGTFSYINQINECDYKDKTKIKIKKWLEIPNLSEYEEFVQNWHDFLSEKRNEIREHPENAKSICMEVLKYYY